MPTEIILLERVDNLGAMGDVVKVKPGYARNYLFPMKKALRATKENVAYFESQKKALESNSAKKREEAEKLSSKLAGQKVVIIRQAAEAGQLFGSVTTRDIADAISAKGFKVDRNQILLNQAFKLIGLFPVTIGLHPEVKVQVTLNIARSEEEAATQEKTGKALIAMSGREEAAAEAAAKAEAAKARAAKAAEEAEAEAAPAEEAAEGEAA
jgi:large subunit ribosomal protein L9